MPISIEQLIARMEWAAKRDLSELTITLDASRVTILREASHETDGQISPVPVAQDATAFAAGPEAPISGAVTATLSGLCHLAAEAGGTPFVTLGQTIEAGQTLCIIEAMKVMTPVPAPAGGTVEAILVEDGSSVEAGAPLVRLS